MFVTLCSRLKKKNSVTVISKTYAVFVQVPPKKKNEFIVVLKAVIFKYYLFSYLNNFYN